MPNSIKRFAACADPADVLTYIKADGVVIIEGAATQESLDTVVKEIGEVEGGQTFALAGKSPTFATNLLVNPLFKDLSRRILSHTYVVYYEQDRTVSTSLPQVSQTSILVAQPGSAPWGLRRQDSCHHVAHPAKRESDFGIAYAATDITKDNGAIRVVVGSNNWKDERDPAESDEYLCELRKGDAILCLGSIYYGQKANTTNEPSILLTAFATPGYRRQEENQYLAVPWEVAEKYPNHVKEFLGYSISRPYGGSVEHMEPIDYMKVKGDPSKYVIGDII